MILAVAFFWFILIPFLSGLMVRRGWRDFRQRFLKLLGCPDLTYSEYSKAESGTMFRFSGGVESISGEALWVKNRDVTVPVALNKAQVYLLPQEDDVWALPETAREQAERVRWNRVSLITEGAKVFIGGRMEMINDRLTFASAPGEPLLVIFYDGQDQTLAIRAAQAGRHRNEFRNRFTPISFLLGVFSELSLSLYFSYRPAFGLTSLMAFLMMFSPVIPMAPPGLLFTLLHRRVLNRSRLYKMYRDLVSLPLSYASVPDGNKVTLCDELPSWFNSAGYPVFPPELSPKNGEKWHIFGPFVQGPGSGAFFMAVPGNPDSLARNFARRSYILELCGCAIFLLGITLNLSLILMFLYR